LEVDLTKEPSAGEVLVFTQGGGFLVKGSVREVADRLSGEEWPTFELAESEDKVVIRSAQVIALREGKKRHKGSIGFVHGEDT
jgi:hypothetical protein